MAAATNKDNERLIIVFLGAISILCLIGIVVTEAFGGSSNDALLTIGSLAAGALASRVSAKSDAGMGTDVGVQDRAKPDDEDSEFAVIGRAATRSMVAEAMRAMALASAADEEAPKQ